MLFSDVVAILLTFTTCALAVRPQDSDERLVLDDASVHGIEDLHHARFRQSRTSVTGTSETRESQLDVFATRTVNVPQSFAENATSLAQAGASIRGKALIRPAAKDLSITKYSAALIQEAQSLSLPGKMQSAPLYIFDIVALPQENSFAVFALDSRMISAVTNYGSKSHSRDLIGLSPAVTDELTKLPIRLLSTRVEHTMKCAILKDNTVDGNCVGASQVLMCRVVGVDIAEELKRVKSKTQSLSIQMGKDIVQISPETLSAAQIGMSLSRNFVHAPNRSDVLRASIVHPMHGIVPPYINETIAYYKLMGVKHVYLGVFMEDIPGSFKHEFQPHITSGYVSLLETDKWPGLSFQAKKNSFASSESAYQMWQTLVNDLALYYSKNFDDLMFVNDYDELVVPTGGSANTLAVVEQILRDGNIVLNDLCFLSLCPQVTYGKGQRNKISRSEDFPFMDDGMPASADGKEKKDDDPLRRFCDKGGYLNIYPKAIAVVETTYKTTVHVPGACSAIHHDPLDGMAVGYHKEVNRDMGLVVQHFTELYEPGRYVDNLHGHREAKSAFSRLWAPKLTKLLVY